MKNFLILIPARKGSKGIKNKNFIKINKISLLERAILFSKKILAQDDIFVSSDSIKAEKICKNNKVNYLKRNKKLSGDKVSDFKLINYCLKNINKISNKYKYIIYLQPTSPLRKVKEILKAMRIINTQKKVNAIISISKVDLKNHPLKVFNLNQNNYLKLFSEEGKKIFARQQLKEVYCRNGLFYIFKISSFRNSKNIYFRNSLGFLINRNIVNLDTYKELLKLKKIIK